MSNDPLLPPPDLPADTQPPLFAFKVSIGDMTCVAFAESAPKARWLAVKSYWNAGYGNRRVWPRPSSTRYPSTG